MIKLSPSLLSADFANLAKEVTQTEQLGVKYLHFDVFDGAFAPNLSFGPDLVKAVRPYTKMCFDVHLMLQKPKMFLQPFAKAGADILNVHLECDENVDMLLEEIKSLGVKSAVTISPETPVDALLPYLDKVDMVLIMSVNPGFSGQTFIESSLSKVKKLAELKEQNGYDFDIEIDGGINLQNVETVLQAGANIIVAGSAFFASEDRKKRFEDFEAIFKRFQAQN